MNRRGHLSHKVPNVKLRPAPAPSTKSSRKSEPLEQSAWDDQATDDEEDEGHIGLSGENRPWTNVVITFTGVDDKTQLTEMVRELGGIVESALTVNVTHVVASGFGSPKYMYAIEHRIPVMTPEWIRSAHECWLGGDDMNQAELQEMHYLLPFQGLKIAISGIENLDRRKEIVKQVNGSGGVYSKDLDRTCTHLISAVLATSDAKSSEKIRWALKENQTRDVARRRGKKADVENIKILYEEWIWDCVAYRGRWKEEGYDARKSRPKGKVRAEDVIDGTVFQQAEETKPEVVKEEESEPAVVRKRKTGSMANLVGDLISTTGKAEPKEERIEEDHDAAMPVAGPSRLGSDLEVAARRAQKEERQPEKRLGPDRQPSVLHRLRATAFDESTRAADARVGEPTDPKATSSFPPTASARDATPSTLPLGPADVESRKEDDQMVPDVKFYDGLRFCHVIEEECRGLEQALLAHGGVLVSNEDRLAGTEVDYIVVRLSSHNRPEFPEGIPRPEVVTECWVEACCFEHRMKSPDEHLVFKPLSAPMPIPDADKLNIHLSGLSTSDTVYTKRLIKAIGARLSEKMNRSTTHLISTTNDSPKALKTPEWGIKLVKQSWLLAVGAAGEILPEEPHLHAAPPPRVLGTTPTSRQLGSGTSMANMSMVLEVGDPTYERGKVAPPSGTPTDQLVPPPNKLSQVSPSRQLKLTPTHIDDDGNHGGASLGTSSLAGKTSVDPSNVLSPPRQERERLLNNAETNPSQKLARTVSAPPNSDSIKEKPSSPLNPLRGASTGGPSSIALSKGKPDVTEALRLLAQQDPTPPSKSRAQRRQRTASRLRQGGSGRVSHSPSTTAGSPLKRMTPDLFDPDNSVYEADEMSEQYNGIIKKDEMPDESIRVNYIDPSAEKHKRKLMAVIESSKRAETKISPNKRSKR